jgi:hypothetical protein
MIYANNQTELGINMKMKFIAPFCRHRGDNGTTYDKQNCCSPQQVETQPFLPPKNEGFSFAYTFKEAIKEFLRAVKRRARIHKRDIQGNIYHFYYSGALAT